MNDRGAPGHTSLEHLLDAVAIHPELDGLLIYDASGAQLARIADLLEARLAAVGPAVDRVVLGASHDEDGLWGSGHGLPAPWQRRGLLRARDDRQLLVVIPDLAQLSVSAARAAVTLLGVPSAHVERHGESAIVTPGRMRWLAGLAAGDTGQVSPHLIDRFAVQVRLRNDAVWSPARKVAIVAAELAGHERAAPAVEEAVAARLRAATRRSVALGPGATEEALAISGSRVRGMRRPIAILRMAGALAQLADVERVTPAHVRAAATMIGLTVETAHAPTPGPGGDAGQTTTPGAEVDPSSRSRDNLAAVSTTPRNGGGPSAGAGVPDGVGDMIDAAERALDSVELGPAPISDQAAVQRDHASLTLPWRRSGGRARGAVMGTRRTGSLEDIAVAATLIAAAPFQPLRRTKAGVPAETAQILRRSDLRAYRRAPVAEDLLALVIDYTSVAGRDWHPAILPYLAEAYTARAQIALVAVGAGRNGSEETWRADLITARSILVPAVAAALDRSAARSTPLAHGLELAYRTISRSLSHGRGAIQRATLVVVTDGRGNVPLAMSHGDRWSGPVGRRGIEDARRLARAIRELPHVRCVLIDPRPATLPDLPRSLAAALGAEIVLLGQEGP